MEYHLNALTATHNQNLAHSEPASYLPARSDLDVDGGLAVPEDGDVFLGEMNHCEVSGWPDEHPLLPVNHAGWILQRPESVNFTEIFSNVILKTT